MYLSLFTFFHIAICVLLILIVLLQQGRGADMGATFGGGSNTLFGAGGADNLLTRVTTVMAFLFMFTSLVLSSGLKSSSATHGALYDSLPASAPLAPTAPAPSAPESSAGAPDAAGDVPPSQGESAALPQATQASGESATSEASRVALEPPVAGEPVADMIEPAPAPTDSSPIGTVAPANPNTENSTDKTSLPASGNPGKDVVTDAPPVPAPSLAPKE